MNVHSGVENFSIINECLLNSGITITLVFNTFLLIAIFYTHCVWELMGAIKLLCVDLE